MAIISPYPLGLILESQNDLNDLSQSEGIDAIRHVHSAPLTCARIHRRFQERSSFPVGWTSIPNQRIGIHQTGVAFRLFAEDSRLPSKEPFDETRHVIEEFLHTAASRFTTMTYNSVHYGALVAQEEFS